MALAGLKLAVLFGFIMLIGHCQAAQYTVGGTVGWTLGSVNYNQWAGQNTYKVGDTLLFVYSAGDHTVLQVNKADYDACSTTTPLKSYMGGNTVVTLSKAGNYWFICGVVGHCPTMAFGINVTAAAVATPPPKAAPAPPPTVVAPSPSPTALPPSANTTAPTASAPSPSPAAVSPSANTTAPSPSKSGSSVPPVSSPAAPPPAVSAPPPSPPSKSGSSALTAEPRGNAYMLLLGTIALVFCSVLHPF